MPPGTSLAATKTAPAPSPKRTQVLRSDQSTSRDRVSAPITSTYSAALLAINPRATPRPYTNPEQAALKSNACRRVAPRPSCTREAVDGKRCSGEAVATITISTRFAGTSATRNASCAALMARVAVVSCGSVAMCLWRIPVRVRIHSSLVSTMRDRSSLVRMWLGTLFPHPTIWAYLPTDPLPPLRFQTDRTIKSTVQSAHHGQNPIGRFAVRHDESRPSLSTRRSALVAKTETTIHIRAWRR